LIGAVIYKFLQDWIATLTRNIGSFGSGSCSSSSCWLAVSGWRLDRRRARSLVRLGDRAWTRIRPRSAALGGAADGG